MSAVLAILAVAPLRWASAQPSWCLDEPTENPALLLVQVAAQGRTVAKTASPSLRRAVNGNNVDDLKCSPLQNHGSYFSVELQVGTPSGSEPQQKFDVVADSGSDAVIIASCICSQEGECSIHDRCFQGTNKSSTFLLPSGQVPIISMEFGSGTIEAAVTTDVVKVGGTAATMEESLLLMVDRRLDIQGTFEGILGLGQLQSEFQGDSQKIAGFLREASIDTFSLCFNGDTAGALRLDTKRQKKPMPSVGTMHWGLDFRGVSVGDEESELVICDPAKTPYGQETACGAIPDSGTTVMLGPEQHILSMFTSLCEQWPRCVQTAKNRPEPKAEVFQELLHYCGEWMEPDGTGLDELPSLFFHFAGANGENPQTIEFGGWAYIFESDGGEAEMHRTSLLKGAAASKSHTWKAKSGSAVCIPAFGTSEYTTSQNGAVWVIGTPLFYEYTVHFDLNPGNNKNPTIAFEKGVCSECGQSASLMSEGSVAAHGTHPKRIAKRLRNPPRIPKRDTSRPL